MLDGKVAIVSGASYGMGYSMAELFAKEGARVVMTARGKEKLDAAVKSIRDQGYDVTGVVADNKNLDDVKKVIHKYFFGKWRAPLLRSILYFFQGRH